MSIVQKIALYCLLIFLGLSLVIPGLIEVFKKSIGIPGLIPDAIDAKNHFRALNGMMTAIGCLALWACINLENSRSMIISFGIIMGCVVVARTYSCFIDGVPSRTTMTYLAVEAGLAIVFLFWSPSSKQ